MSTSDNIDALAAAMAKAQAIIQNPTKGKKNTFFKEAGGKPSTYADLASGLKCIRPALSANGCAFFQMPFVSDNYVFLRSRIVHLSGQWIESEYPVGPLSLDPQKLAAAMTYARRNAGFALVGIAGTDDDDDGNSTQSNGHPATISAAPELSVSSRAFIDHAKSVIGEFNDTGKLKEWWANDKQRSLRQALNIMPATGGEQDRGFNELWDAFCARGRELGKI